LDEKEIKIEEHHGILEWPKKTNEKLVHDQIS
jgi:hypothetical protein